MNEYTIGIGQEGFLFPADAVRKVFYVCNTVVNAQSALVVADVLVEKIKADFRKIGNTAPRFIVSERVCGKLKPFGVRPTKDACAKITVSDGQGIPFPAVRAIVRRYAVF